MLIAQTTQGDKKMVKADTIDRISPLMIRTLVKRHYKVSEPCNFTAAPSTVKSVGTYEASVELAEEEGREFLDWNKSSISQKQDALENPNKYFVFADIRASETDIGELRLQDLQNGKDYISFKYNILFKAMSQPQSKGILFFDEMNLAPNMIKAQFYKIINDKAVGDIPISEGVLCVSAGNEAEHARGVTEDPVPLVLRRANYFVRPLKPEEYLDFATKKGYNKHIVGYLAFQPQDVHNIQYDLAEGVGQPCPRTWTKLNSIQDAELEKDIDLLQTIATGFVGQGVARKYVAYVKSAKNIDLNSVIKNPSKINELEDNDLSLVYAVITGLVEKYRDNKKDMLKPILEIANAMKRTELGTFLVRSVKNVDSKAFMKFGLTNVDASVLDAFADRYQKYVSDR